MPTRTAPVQASCVYRACDILGQRVARGAPGSANVPPPICRQWRLASRTRMGWWLRRRRGVGLRSERPGITGPWGRRRRGTRGPTRSHERPWGQRSVHRSAKTAPRSRSGAFVYTVAPSWAGVGAKECTQIGENGPTEPFWGICVHCCDASRVGWNEGLDRHGASAPAPPLAWRLR